jgi:Methylase involved in ubiquinone/menaquinone biosynthesis
MTRLPESTARRYGKVFDEIAAEYDRHRPTYPDELVDQACQVAGIGSGDHVLEVGCGSGQLTRGLVARGLHVTALEPGKSLIALARQNLEGAGEVEFVNAQFEDALLPREQFQAVFSASAFHWVDPKVSWQKAADVLVPGGTLALVQYCGLEEPRSKRDQEAALAAMRKVAPDIAANWPAYRDLDATLAGMEQRRGNVSEVWAWLGSYDIGQDYAAACSVMFRWQSCQSSSSTLLTSSMLSFVRCRFTLGFHRVNVKTLSVNTRPFMSDSGDRFALARSRLSSRHGAAPREMITAHCLRHAALIPSFSPLEVLARVLRVKAEQRVSRGHSRVACPAGQTI